MKKFEIERKFLLAGTLADIVDINTSYEIEQCYLPHTGDWAIRTRKRAEAGQAPHYFLTMKNRVSDRRNVEIETEIAGHMYDEVKASCGHSPLRKIRHVTAGGWEVDVFQNAEIMPQGLVIAEIELQDEDQVFARPPWLGEEVTGVRGYSNESLAKTWLQLPPEG